MGDGASSLSLTDVLDKLADKAGEDTVTLGDLLGAFGRRAYGPLLLIPAIVAVAPTGAIPGMSIVTGSLVGLVALQLLVGRPSPWLPPRLLRISFSRELLDRSIGKARPVASWTERFIRPRLTFLTSAPFPQIAAIICILMAASMYPLALVPFGVALPGTAVGVIGLGLTSQDGALVLAGVGLSVASGYLLFTVL